NGNPNIISVYEFFYENNTTYFVMEYLDGVDLKTYIKQKGGKIPEGEALYIADKVIQALMIVHSTNILHRDISPDNIFICSDGKIKLIDFGAARQVMGEVSKSLSVVLKEGFAPYEQYSTKGKQGPWTDIYALGATLYYALTGEKLDNAMDRLTENSQLSLENISPGFAEIITKMVEVKKEDRYQDTFELSKAFSALIAIAENEETEKVDETVNDEETVNEEETVKYEENNKEVKNKVSLSEKIKAFTVGAVQKIKDSAGEINLDAKAKKRILAVVGSIAVIIISVVIAVSVTDKNSVTESSGGNISGNGTHTLNGTIDVNDFTEESKTSATEKEKTKAEKEEKTTKKKTSTTKKRVTTTKKKVTTTKKNMPSFTPIERVGYIATGDNHTVVLHPDGTLTAIGDNSYGQCDVSQLTGFATFYTGPNVTYAEMSNGDIYYAGHNYIEEVEYADDIPAEWLEEDLAGCIGTEHLLAILPDKTVGAVGNNSYGECNVSGWKNIICLAEGADHSIGLNSNGKVVATGRNNYGQCNVSGWKNIVFVDASDSHTVGLKSDGTVVATGKNTYGQCNVSGWKDIIAISVGENHTVGLKSDGTVVAVGRNNYGQCNVSSLKKAATPLTKVKAKFDGLG
ncbi:MAG: protein kinase, partial [Clostridia bacterium]|nr:protein kinase [Clostridia bacterium]